MFDLSFKFTNDYKNIFPWFNTYNKLIKMQVDSTKI